MFASILFCINTQCHNDLIEIEIEIEIEKFLAVFNTRPITLPATCSLEWSTEKQLY